MFTLSSHLLQLFSEDTKVLSGQIRYKTSPKSPTSALRPSPSWSCPKHLRRYPNQMIEAPQLIPLDVEQQRLCSEFLLDDWTPHTISKGEFSHPAEEIQFICLRSQSCSFAHYPRFMTAGEGRNLDWPLSSTRPSQPQNTQGPNYVSPLELPLK